MFAHHYFDVPLFKFGHGIIHTKTENVNQKKFYRELCVWSGQQEIRRRPLAGTAGGGNRMPSSRREPAFFGTLKKDSVSSCVRNNNNNPSGTGLDLDRLHVLKIKCKDPSPSMNSTTITTTTTTTNNNNITKDIKFSKYSPLPAIKKTRPSLLREKTYDVLEPVFVKGPIQDATVTEPLPPPAEVRIKLPEIRTNKIPTSKVRKPPPKELLTASTSPPNKKDILKSQPAAAAATTVRLKTSKIRQPFNPNLISKSSMPENPTVFWFPV